MQATEITVSVTKQVRQYEPERIEVTVELEDGDTVQDGIAYARNEIKYAFSTEGRLDQSLRLTDPDGYGSS